MIHGTRAVSEALLKAYPEAEISLFIVWINILPGDTEEAALESSGAFAGDPRVIQFYDPERLSGRAVASSLGGEEGKVGWDIYLFYEPGLAWTASPPVPRDWAHQLTDSSWVDPKRYHAGDDLRRQLQATMRDFLAL